MTNPERPHITSHHREFHKRLTAFGIQFAEAAFAQIQEHCVPFPDELTRETVETSFHHSIDFKKDARHAGSIAAGDSFAFKELLLVDEGVDNEDLSAGRILELDVLAGSSLWVARLYAGPDTPPMLFDKETISASTDSRIGKGSTDLRSAGIYLEEFPETKLCYPEGDELALILRGLSHVVPAGHIDVLSNVESLSEQFRGSSTQLWAAGALETMRGVQQG